MCTQLAAEIRVLVFGPGGGQLSAKLGQLDVAGFLLAAYNIVPRKQQITVILGKVALKSRYRYLTGTADFHA